MPDYLLVLSECFPGAEAYTAGDPTVYGDLIWETTPILQATLDASDCAINGPTITSIPDPIIPNGGIPDGSHIQWNGTLGAYEFVIPASGGNSIGTLSGDTGSSVADSSGDTMTIAGDGGKISTVASDTTDTITVSFAGLDVDELLDVDVTTNAPLADNYTLRYDTTSGKWIATPSTSPPPPPTGLDSWHDSFSFSKGGSAGDSFMDIDGSMTSNTSTYVALSSGKISHVAVSVGDKKNDDSTIILVKNATDGGGGSLAGGTQIGSDLSKNQNELYQIWNNLVGYTFSAGDRISVYVEKNPNGLESPVVTVYVTYD